MYEISVRYTAGSSRSSSRDWNGEGWEGPHRGRRGFVGGHLATDFLWAEASVECLFYSSSVSVYVAEKQTNARCGAMWCDVRERRLSGDARRHAASKNFVV